MVADPGRPPFWAPVHLGRMALGCELLGGADWGTVDQDEALATVRAAYDAGVTVFDTADVYGLGRSEALLSEALGDHLRDVVIVTKGGIAWQTDASGRARTRKDLSPGHLHRAVRASLQRLGLECIPLYLAHWPDGVHEVHEVIGTLSELRDEGLVGAFGLSNFDISDLRAPGVLEAIAAVELEHSLLRPATGALEAATAAGVPALLYGCLGQGLLTGKYAAGHSFGTDDRRHRLSHFTGDHTVYEPLLDVLAGTAREASLTQAQTAIAWALATSPTGVAVVGARTRRQLADNLSGAAVRLSPDQVARLGAQAGLSAP